MYWLTKQPCLSCGSLTPPGKRHEKEDPVYAMVRNAIFSELRTEPSNRWPDEGIPSSEFPLGMVKIYIGRKWPQRADYQLKCFVCGFNISRDECAEKAAREAAIEKIFRNTHYGNLRPRVHDPLYGNYFGLWHGNTLVIPPLESFG